METKTCKVCNTEKNLIEFNPSGYSPTGLAYYKYCKECTNKKAREKRALINKNNPNFITTEQKRKHQSLQIIEGVTYKGCSKCRKVLELSNFVIAINEKSGYYCYCNNCKRAMARQWNSNNKIKVARKGKLYRQRYPEKVRQIEAKKNYKARINLSDSYIKQLIVSSSKTDVYRAGDGIVLSRKDIPQNLVELKRKEILLQKIQKSRIEEVVIIRKQEKALKRKLRTKTKNQNI